MTDIQFSQWLQQHVARFTSVGKELAAMPAEQRKLTADSWKDALRQVPLEDAIAATAELFESSQRPPYFDRIPAAIRAICQRMMTERQEAEKSREYARYGEATVGCPRCDDLGQVVVRVYGPLLNTAILQAGGDIDKASRRTCAVLCDCDAGRRLRGKRRGVRHDSFRPGEHVLA
jgi:hypothetical protein